MTDSARNAAQVFVSHISEEAELAAQLKKMMKRDFLGLVDFFTSSDVGSIDAGQDWLVAVQQAMNRAKAVIVLCSKASVERPWVHFEVGAAYMKGIPIIPICHSGMTIRDLRVPLSLRQAMVLNESGLSRLYDAMAKILKTETPTPSDLATRLLDIAALEARFRRTGVQQFELSMNIKIPPPGRLESESIPDKAIVELEGDSLKLFGFIPSSDVRTWKDIVDAAGHRRDIADTGRPDRDTRWITQLQECVYLASVGRSFQPLQAIFHTDIESYQPQLAKKEVLLDGTSLFHVHFVETVVAPLYDVENDFGLLATLLRLGLRFRYEVIERFPRIANALPNSDGKRNSMEDVLHQLQGAIRVIEIDALSRGAQNIDPSSVVALFDRTEDRDTIKRMQTAWDEARRQLFASDGSSSIKEVGSIIDRMCAINYSFMDLGSRRLHEMVTMRWNRGA